MSNSKSSEKYLWVTVGLKKHRSHSKHRCVPRKSARPKCYVKQKQDQMKQLQRENRMLREENAVLREYFCMMEGEERKIKTEKRIENWQEPEYDYNQGKRYRSSDKGETTTCYSDRKSNLIKCDNKRKK